MAHSITIADEYYVSISINYNNRLLIPVSDFMAIEKRMMIVTTPYSDGKLAFSLSDTMEDTPPQLLSADTVRLLFARNRLIPADETESDS